MAAGAGLGGVIPRVLATTNNVVVALDPDPVVAKVGTWAHSDGVLRREHEVARRLAARGDVPAGRPLADVPVLSDEGSGLTVTLWERLDAVAEGVEPGALAASLQALHAGLDAIAPAPEVAVGMPSFLWALDLAAETLADDDRMAAMAPADLAFLREAFAALQGDARRVDAVAPQRLLHGEPHAGNVIVTASGPRWIDFEAVCTGPLEYDLASTDAEVAAAYGPHDADRLVRLRLVNRARVAVWCWAGSERGDLRVHAEVHLAHLRAALA